MISGSGRRSWWSTRQVAGVTVSGFLIVAFFQVTLALGAPFGSAALGGANAGRLPPELRLATTVVAAFWVLAAVHALSRGGLTKRFPRLGNRRFTWVLVGVTALGVLMNAASSSPWERYGWAPYTLFLMVVCLILARSDRVSDPSEGWTSTGGTAEGVTRVAHRRGDDSEAGRTLQHSPTSSTADSSPTGGCRPQ
jgi:hypothetical protein